MDDNKGLILTVGFSPEPLIFAIKKFEATHVIFIGTKDSIEKSLDKVVVETGLKPTRYQFYSIPDSSENVSLLVNKFREGFNWLKSFNIGEEAIGIDPTGGYKWMSSGMVMAASFLGLQIIYIHADYENRKPIPGSEKMVSLGNVYDQIGFVAAEQGREAFNNAAFDNAEAYFSKIRPSSSDRAELFKGLAKLSKVLGRWDRFEHYDTKISDELSEAVLLLSRSFESGGVSSEFYTFFKKIEILQEGIMELEAQKELKIGFIIDVFLNAKRRFSLHRYDDCVGRLYRTVEAVSQYCLKTEFGIIASKPNFDNINNLDEEKKKFEELGFGQFPDDKLSLLNSYQILYVLGSDVGKIAFNNHEDGLRFILDKGSEARNSSILAHGFTPIGKEKALRYMKNIEFNLIRKSLKSEFDSWSKKLTVPTLPELGV